MPFFGSDFIRSFFAKCRALTARSAEPPTPQYRVGEYIADYSELTYEEIHAPNHALDELLKQQTRQLSGALRKS